MNKSAMLYIQSKKNKKPFILRAGGPQKGKPSALALAFAKHLESYADIFYSSDKAISLQFEVMVTFCTALSLKTTSIVGRKKCDFEIEVRNWCL